MRSWALGVAFVLALGACRDAPNIDGAKVPKLASGAGCGQICGRIVQLCGYAPPDCDDAGAGYCDTNFSQDQLDCMGSASSCQQVWDNGTPTGCLYVPPTPDDAATSDSSSDDAWRRGERRRDGLNHFICVRIRSTARARTA